MDATLADNTRQKSCRKSKSDTANRLSSTYRSFRDSDTSITLTISENDQKRRRRSRTLSVPRTRRRSVDRLDQSSQGKSRSIADLETISQCPARGWSISHCLKIFANGVGLQWLGSISQRGGRVNQPKRVAPPTVPDCAPHRHSGSSFTSTGSTESSSGGYCSGEGSATSGWSSDQRSSLGLDDPFLPPASPGVNSLTNKSMFHEGGNLPSPSQAGTFNFPGQQGNVFGQMVNRPGNQATSPSGKLDRDPGITLLPYPNYMQQASIEDQGIDLAQSPGRESPSSSTGSSSSTSAGLKSSCSSAAGTSVLPGCRYSTTSLDSGRASAYDHAHRHGSSSSSSSGGVVHQHQHKLSTGSYAACFRHSYHSSSSSLGSSGKTDDIHRLDFAEMLAQGVPEHEVLNAWLTDMGFEEYYDLFVQAGYDMHTITRMTPEDLTAIGIQKPIHRKKLKAEIAQLSIPDGLPDFIPDSLEEWLALLGLAEYSPSLRRQGYRTVEDVTQLTWEDLEDFGILRLGHQKKILLAIKRVKDILSGKWAPPAPADNCCCCHDTSEQSISSFQQNRSLHYAAAGPGQAIRYSAQQQQHVYLQYKQPLYQPDVVAIQIHHNKSSEDVQNVNTGCQGQYHGASLCKPAWRSYEDGDITPISENAGQLRSAGGGTLPRPRGSVKPRPVAKISAKTRMDGESHEEDVHKVHFHGQPNMNFSKNAQPLGSQAIYGTLAKKNPPPPPKRSLSAEDDPSSVYGHVGKSSPLLPPPPAIFDRQNNATDSQGLLSYPEDCDDFPPPPAPITASDSYLQHGQASAAASVRERLDNILQRSGAAHWPRPPAGATVPNPRLMKNDRECSPCDGNDTSDTEPGSPAAEFRQRRNGSDASFKSTSSTESDSMPFANDNAGTIKQRAARQHQALSGLAYAPARTPKNPEATDVLNDIGSMLAGLAVELDAMLEEENKQKV